MKKRTNQDRFQNALNEHFGFLTDKFGFIKIPEYQYVYEVHNDYVKPGLIIKIIYDGGFWVNILKPNFSVEEIIKGEKRTNNYALNKYNLYNLKNLDLDKSIYNSVSANNFPDKDLWYFSKLLKENPEILNGNTKKLTWIYHLMKKIGIS